MFTLLCRYKVHLRTYTGYNRMSARGSGQPIPAALVNFAQGRLCGKEEIQIESPGKADFAPRVERYETGINDAGSYWSSILSHNGRGSHIDRRRPLHCSGEPGPSVAGRCSHKVRNTRGTGLSAVLLSSMFQARLCTRSNPCECGGANGGKLYDVILCLIVSLYVPTPGQRNIG